MEELSWGWKEGTLGRGAMIQESVRYSLYVRVSSEDAHLQCKVIKKTSDLSKTQNEKYSIISRQD